MLNDYFDQILYINLNRRPDRRMEMESTLSARGITAKRLKAVDGNTVGGKGRLLPGEHGCLRSHIAALEMVVVNGWGRTLILEDDIDFDENIQEKFPGEIPVEWDMLYLGGVHNERPAKVNQTIGRITHTHTTGSYGVSLAFASHVLDILRQSVAPVDAVYATLHASNTCYAFVPSVAWQRPGHSDIQGGFRDYTNLNQF